MDEALLLDRIIQISKENGALAKENEIIKENNKILIDKLNSQSQLKDLADILDELLNVDNREIDKKTRLLEQDRIRDSLDKFRKEATSKTVLKRVIKKEPITDEKIKS